MAERVRPKSRIVDWRPSARAIGITGSPGTGKKSLARELSFLTGLRIVSLNEIAIRERIGRWHGGEFEVDLEPLRRRVVDTKGKIVVGHLLPHIVSASKLDYVAVLRCSPRVLQQRYAKRRYSKAKSDENVAAEILDVVSYSALKKYGRTKVAEFDTTRVKNVRNLAWRVLATFEGKRPKLYGRVNWSQRGMKSNLKFLETMQGGIASVRMRREQRNR